MYGLLYMFLSFYLFLAGLILPDTISHDLWKLESPAILRPEQIIVSRSTISSLAHARSTLSNWRSDYNGHRPERPRNATRRYRLKCSN